MLQDVVEGLPDQKPQLIRHILCDRSVVSGAQLDDSGTVDQLRNRKPATASRVSIARKEPDESVGESVAIGQCGHIGALTQVNNGVNSISFTIYGEPASKANSRRFIRPGLIIKSAKALSYAEAFLLQAPKLASPISVPVCVEATIHYSSMRPDLDESLILDLMQRAGIYRNDRLVIKKVITRGFDKACPRADIRVYPLDQEGDGSLAAALAAGGLPGPSRRLPRHPKRTARGRQVDRKR